MGQVNPIQVQKFLSGVDYPCDRDGIVAAAEDNGADKDILDALKAIPDRTYDGPSAVSQAVS
ncbi:DUF2795 domain-containing protein [Nocardia pneumoniae]|uniref:DUF2795 domain-containing protein n=1 Tax=Nocardia pneumoniae TaxID=228601 RepID=UPI0002D78FE1|nr:DUF2795 domain-containing protein [Nocardia pneumoniae]